MTHWMYLLSQKNYIDFNHYIDFLTNSKTKSCVNRKFNKAFLRMAQRVIAENSSTFATSRPVTR